MKNYRLVEGGLAWRVSKAIEKTKNAIKEIKWWVTNVGPIVGVTVLAIGAAYIWAGIGTAL